MFSASVELVPRSKSRSACHRLTVRYQIPSTVQCHTTNENLKRNAALDVGRTGFKVVSWLHGWNPEQGETNERTHMTVALHLGLVLLGAALVLDSRLLFTCASCRFELPTYLHAARYFSTTHTTYTLYTPYTPGASPCSSKVHVNQQVLLN
eukprot:1161060-Pelagomonas_calceolata.AAC.15